MTVAGYWLSLALVAGLGLPDGETPSGRGMGGLHMRVTSTLADQQPVPPILPGGSTLAGRHSVPPLVLGMADREESVASGREVLDRWVWPYPWYDRQTDGVRRVDVVEPWYLRWEWFWDWLGDLFRFSWGGLGSLSWLEWVAWGAIVILLGLLVYLMVRTVRKRRLGKSGSAGEAGQPDEAEEKRRVEALPSAVGRNRADLLAAARQCYDEGNYGEAIIYLFSHQLVELDKGLLIRLAKGKTNRQYLRELGRRLPLRRLLGQTMVAFEDTFFGNHAIDRARFESVWSRLGEFEALVAGGAA